MQFSRSRISIDIFKRKTRTKLELNPKTPDEVSSPLVALLPAMQCAKYTKSFVFN